MLPLYDNFSPKKDININNKFTSLNFCNLKEKLKYIHVYINEQISFLILTGKDEGHL